MCIATCIILASGSIHATKCNRKHSGKTFQWSLYKVYMVSFTRKIIQVIIIYFWEKKKKKRNSQREDARAWAFWQNRIHLPQMNQILYILYNTVHILYATWMFFFNARILFLVALVHVSLHSEQILALQQLEMSRLIQTRLCCLTLWWSLLDIY